MRCGSAGKASLTEFMAPSSRTANDIVANGLWCVLQRMDVALTTDVESCSKSVVMPPAEEVRYAGAPL